jgi:hypothetical protein
MSNETTTFSFHDRVKVLFKFQIVLLSIWLAAVILGMTTGGSITHFLNGLTSKIDHLIYDHFGGQESVVGRLPYESEVQSMTNFLFLEKFRREDILMGFMPIANLLAALFVFPLRFKKKIIYVALGIPSFFLINSLLVTLMRSSPVFLLLLLFFDVLIISIGFIVYSATRVRKNKERFFS